MPFTWPKEDPKDGGHDLEDRLFKINITSVVLVIKRLIKKWRKKK